MLETHGMLRSDTTVLFERLREANGLLQEVLAGANTNLGSIEQVLSTRVADFVGTMNNLLEKTGGTTTRMDEHIGGFYEVTGKVLENLDDLASSFDQHGRELADAATMLSNTNRETESAVADRRGMLENLVTALDARTDDLDTRLKRFNGLLDELLASAEGRARDIARTIADPATPARSSSPSSSRPCARTPRTEQRRTIESMREIYESATGDAQSMFQGAAERFSEIVQGMKHMAGDMQRELEIDPAGTSPRHSRTAAGDRRKRRADAPRDRRPDRGAGRTQPHRRPPWPRDRNRRAGRAARSREESGRRCRQPSRAPQARATYVGNAPPVAPPRSAPAAPKARRRSSAVPRRSRRCRSQQGPGSDRRPDQLAVRPPHPRLARRRPQPQPQRGEARGPRRRRPRNARPATRSSRSTRSRSISPA